MIKENRDYQLKVRLTNSEKENVINYAAAHNITISELVRAAIQRYLGGKENG